MIGDMTDGSLLELGIVLLCFGLAALFFAARVIWLVVRWLNQRDDARCWKRPPDPP